MTALAVLLCLGGAAVTATAQGTPRVAFLYSDWRPMDRTFLDTPTKALGWQIDRWNVADIGRLMGALPQYDFLVTSPCWNFEPGHEYKAKGARMYPPELSRRGLRDFVEGGGGLVHMDVGDDKAGDLWEMGIDETSDWSLGKCDFDEADAAWQNPEAPFQFEGLTTASWLHFESHDAGCMELGRCAHGKPTILWRPVGAGFLLTTVLTYNGPCSEANFPRLWAWLQARDRKPRQELGLAPILPLPAINVSEVRAANRKSLRVWADEEFALAAMSMSDKLTNRTYLTERCEGLRLAGARGEYACASVAVVPGAGCGKLSVSTEGFEGLEATARPVQALTYTRDLMYAEVVRNRPTFQVPRSMAAAQVWLTVRISEGTPKGVQCGTLVVTGERTEVRVPVEVQVYGFDLPRQQHLPTDFAFRPGLCFELFNNSEWYGEGWEKSMTFEMYAKWREFIMRYRITPQPYMDSPSVSIPAQMTNQAWLEGEWDGKTFTPDWTRFDAQIEHQFANGAAMARVGFTGGPKPGTERWNFWLSYLPQLEAHVRENGWERRCFVYQQDEVRKEWWQDFATRSADIARLAPSVKRLTVLQSPLPVQLDACTDIWVPSFGALSGNRQRMHDLKAEGDSVWVYVCTSPAPPNSELFMYEPGLDHRLLPWIIRQQGLEGLLYYGCTFWSQQTGARIADVSEDGALTETWGMKGQYYSGGGIMVYPGGKLISDEPQASLRLELLRQGLQDYEYFWMLNDLLERGKGSWVQRRDARRLLEIPVTIVAGPGSFTTHEALVDAHKTKVAHAIEGLLNG